MFCYYILKRGGVSLSMKQKYAPIPLGMFGFGSEGELAIQCNPSPFTIFREKLHSLFGGNKIICVYRTPLSLQTKSTIFMGMLMESWEEAY